MYIILCNCEVVPSQPARYSLPASFCNVHISDVHCSSRPVPLQREAGRSATREAAWCSSSDHCR